MTTATATNPAPAEVIEIRRQYDDLVRARREGSITREQENDGRVALITQLDAFNEGQPQPPDCPGWCNDHMHEWGLVPEDDQHHLHRHYAAAEGWYLSAWNADDGTVSVAPEVVSSELTVGQARALAEAVLRACDAIEAAQQ